MTNIAVLVSGGGTNLQALIDAQAAGKIENGSIRLVISSNPEAFALERAAKASIPSAVLRRRDFDSAEDYDAALTALLEEYEIGLIVLAGFMTVLPDSFCSRYENRIINVHPSLIPSFCGAGFYGLRVHRAALDVGVRFGFGHAAALDQDALGAADQALIFQLLAQTAVFVDEFAQTAVRGLRQTDALLQ